MILLLCIVNVCAHSQTFRHLRRQPAQQTIVTQQPIEPLMVALIVESKLSAGFFDALMNARVVLPHNYSIIVATTRKNWSYFDQPTWRRQNIFVTRAIEPADTYAGYSDLMIGCKIWQSLSAKYVLVFQTDSRFCTASAHKIEQFIAGNYAWIGAPWHPNNREPDSIAHSRVGNGGFSLRLRTAMLACCSDTNKAKHAEDLQLVGCIRAQRLPIAPIDIAEMFAAESYFRRDSTTAPLGIHKTYAHMQSNLRLRSLCAEYDMLAHVSRTMK